MAAPWRLEAMREHPRRPHRRRGNRRTRLPRGPVMGY